MNNDEPTRTFVGGEELEIADLRSMDSMNDESQNFHEKKEIMDEEEVEKTIVLPKNVQKRMMEFFLKTSIPRKKRQMMEEAKKNAENSQEK